MSLFALTLLLIAAVLHAGWNLLVKRVAEKQIFTWWALLIAGLIFAPLLLFEPPAIGEVWPLLAASAVAECLYFIALTYAYDLADFSLVYPLARGAAPALLALWATLFLGEQLTGWGLAGLALLLCGLVIVGSGSWLASRRRPDARNLRLGIAAALVVACCISIYSVLDAAAVRLTSPAPYTVLVLTLTGLIITPVVLLRYGRRKAVLTLRADWRLIIIVGLLNLVVYVLVLQAYSISKVSYAGAIREISVVFAALAGWRLLGESFGLVRTIGSILIFAGILVIAVSG